MNFIIIFQRLNTFMVLWIKVFGDEGCDYFHHCNEIWKITYRIPYRFKNFVFGISLKKIYSLTMTSLLGMKFSKLFQTFYH